MNKGIMWLIVLAVFVAFGFVLLRGSSQKPQPTPPPAAQVTPTEAQPEAVSLTPEATPAAMKEVTVTVTESGFEPATVTIKAGEKVTWMNKSGASVSINSAPHPTHEAYPPLNLGIVKDGASVSLTFDKAGTYKYHNHLDPSQTGEVVVK